MSIKTAPFFSLPRELRDEIYLYALITHQAEIPVEVKGSDIFSHHKRDVKPYKDRPRALLLGNTSADHTDSILRCSLPISQVSRQTREDFADFLRAAPCDVVVKIQNFDFSLAINFLHHLPQCRRDQFFVNHDGTAISILYPQIDGPFDLDWRVNLMYWIDFLDSVATDPKDELMTFLKATVDIDDMYGEWFSDPMGKLVFEVYTMYQCQARGTGRLEFDKIFYALLCKYRADKRVRHGRCNPNWNYTLSDKLLIPGGPEMLPLFFVEPFKFRSGLLQISQGEEPVPSYDRDPFVPHPTFSTFSE